MSLAQRVLAAELWLLAMRVHLDGWSDARLARAEQLLLSWRRIRDQ